MMTLQNSITLCIDLLAGELKDKFSIQTISHSGSPSGTVLIKLFNKGSGDLIMSFKYYYYRRRIPVTTPSKFVFVMGKYLYKHRYE